MSAIDYTSTAHTTGDAAPTTSKDRPIEKAGKVIEEKCINMHVIE
jgi:hypothetical protein